MISILPHGAGCLANCLIVDSDDDRCGLCFGDGGTPLLPEHDYRHHTNVELPTERFDVVTDRYVGWWDTHDWSQGFEMTMQYLERKGYTVVAARRIRRGAGDRRD